MHVTTQPVPHNSLKESGQQVLYSVRKMKARVCAIQETDRLSEEAIDDCAIPTFSESSHYGMPHAPQTGFPAFWTSTVRSFVMYQDG